MKYIRKLEIKDFMTHKYTVMEFSDGINVITGDTASGKSNIIRALIWAFYNSPAGDKFIRYGAKEAQVSIELSDGVKVVRGKDYGSTNYYHLYAADGKKTEFNNFGHDFPPEIQNALGLSEVRISDKSDPVYLNVCAQLEQPFFVDDETVNSSERAKWISALMKIDEIDSLVDDLSSDVISLKRFDLKNHQEKLKQQEEEMKVYDSLPTKEWKLNQGQEAIEDLEKKNEKLTLLLQAKKQMVEYSHKVELFKNKTKVIEDVLQYEPDIIDLQNNYDTVKVLLQLVYQLNILKKKMKDLNEREKYLSLFDNIETLPLTENTVKIKKLISLKKNWVALNTKLLENEKHILSREEGIADITQKYADILQEIGKCPICMTDIDSDLIQHIKEELNIDEDGF